MTRENGFVMKGIPAGACVETALAAGVGVRVPGVIRAEFRIRLFEVCWSRSTLSRSSGSGARPG